MTRRYGLTVQLRKGDKDKLLGMMSSLECESLSDMVRKLADGVLRIDYATVKRTDETCHPTLPIQAAEDTLSQENVKRIRQLAIAILSETN